MFKNLLQKALTFAQLYDETKDISLLNNCENVPQYKEMLRVFNRLSLDDLCLDDKTIREGFVPETISAATVVEDNLISIGYFFIPAGMRLSPHDHPGMLVTSKILMGEIQRRAMDLVDREQQFELPLNPVFDIEERPYSDTRLEAILESDEVFSEGEMLNLTPIEGNIHTFVAVKDTIIIDVLTPYYDQETRFCNFYEETMNPRPKLAKKPKKEVTEEDRKKKGYKMTLTYLYEAPKINFKVVSVSENLLKDSSQ